jgi:hypothetical protein
VPSHLRWRPAPRSDRCKAHRFLNLRTHADRLSTSGGSMAPLVILERWSAVGGIAACDPQPTLHPIFIKRNKQHGFYFCSLVSPDLFGLISAGITSRPASRLVSALSPIISVALTIPTHPGVSFWSPVASPSMVRAKMATNGTGARVHSGGTKRFFQRVPSRPNISLAILHSVLGSMSLKFFRA